MLQEHLLKLAKVPLQQIRGQKVSCSLNGIPSSVEIMRVKPVTESRTSEVNGYTSNTCMYQILYVYVFNSVKKKYFV